MLRDATTLEVCQFNSSIQNKVVMVQPTVTNKTPSLRNQKTSIFNTRVQQCREAIKDLPDSSVSE